MLFMNSGMTFAISTTNSAATQAVAQRLATQLRGGEVIELASDLGGGKTTFVQGLARGLGYTGEVVSPTFTLSRIYQLPEGRELHHYDLYRLGQAGVVGEELTESLGDPTIITLIEWAGIIEDELPQDRLRIEFTITGETNRELTFTATGTKSKHIIKALKP
jgi:tRNA threonylcarbamoyladenosine biosynthesis protein TsaE